MNKNKEKNSEGSSNVFDVLPPQIVRETKYGCRPVVNLGSLFP